MPEDPPAIVELPQLLEPATGVGLEVLPALGREGRLIGAAELPGSTGLLELVGCAVSVIGAESVEEEVELEPVSEVAES